MTYALACHLEYQGTLSIFFATGVLQRGNPILSHTVERYKDGYTMLLDSLGYAPRSAKHCPYDKLQQLMTVITTQQNSAVQNHEVSCAYAATSC